MTDVTLGFENIGPREAVRILQRVHPRQSGRNYEAVIQNYARQILEGTWQAGVVQTISISEAGELMDGWHRLHAIIVANRTVRMAVARGVPGDAFAYYDSGKPRDLAFRTGRSKIHTALGNFILKLVRYGDQSRGSTPEELETALDFIAAELGQFEAATPTATKHKVSKASIKVAALLRMKIHPSFVVSITDNYSVLQNGHFGRAPIVISSLYRRLMEENNVGLVEFSLAYLAFDPARASLAKLQLRDYTTVVQEARMGVLQPLIQALA